MFILCFVVVVVFVDKTGKIPLDKTASMTPNILLVFLCLSDHLLQLMKKLLIWCDFRNVKKISIFPYNQRSA